MSFSWPQPCILRKFGGSLSISCCHQARVQGNPLLGWTRECMVVLSGAPVRSTRSCITAKWRMRRRTCSWCFASSATLLQCMASMGTRVLQRMWPRTCVFNLTLDHPVLRRHAKILIHVILYVAILKLHFFHNFRVAPHCRLQNSRMLYHVCLALSLEEVEEPVFEENYMRISGRYAQMPP